MKLAVIGTFYKKFDSSRKAIEAVLASTYAPDEFWVICETEYDLQNAKAMLGDKWPTRMRMLHLPTPTTGGEYDVIPYSYKINHALDNSEADAFVYLDNGSVPHPDKYELMLSSLGCSDKIGAVYCPQRRTGYHEVIDMATEVVPDAFCRLNFTQVMHRKTDARWTMDMQHAKPNDIADALFWRELHKRVGAFYPVDCGYILDDHHIPSPVANGL